MRTSIGRGGWVCVSAEDFPGPLYVRLRESGGKFRITELYLDSVDTVITREHLEALAGIRERLIGALAGPKAKAALSREQDAAGPDLARLASHLLGHGLQSRGGSPSRRHWVQASFRAQMPEEAQLLLDGTIVQQAPYGTGRKRRARRPADPPPSIPRHDGALTPEFLAAVAEYYSWAVEQGRKPAPTIAEACSTPERPVTVRTVHAWIRKARKQGVMPEGTQGKVG